MELQLDQIAEGKQKRIQVLEQFYDNFSRRLAKAQEEIRRIELAAEESDEICPQCQRRLIYKHGRFGKFLACPGFPECRYTKNLVKETGVRCPVDGGMLVERRSRKDGSSTAAAIFPSAATPSGTSP